jgi:hypothetical protein
MKESLMKKFSLFFIVVFIAVLALTACSSDEPEDTGSTEPEPTAVVNVPDQPDESDDTAEEEAPPEAPEVDKSEGIFDVEAMVENLDNYVLRPDDMPDPYKIAVDGEQHLTNLRVINDVGEVEGKRYLAASLRVDGWSLELERVNKEDLIPATIFSQIEVFETAEGAQTAFSPDWFPAYTDEDREVNWIEDGCDYGDACVMYYSEKLEPTTELTILTYEIAFVYKNTLSVVMGRGLDFDMNPDYVVAAAEIMFEKVDAAPMAE